MSGGPTGLIEWPRQRTSHDSSHSVSCPVEVAVAAALISVALTGRVLNQRIRQRGAELLDEFRTLRATEGLAGLRARAATTAFWRPIGASVLLHAAALAGMIAIHRISSNPTDDPPPITVALTPSDPDARVGPQTGIAWQSETEPSIVDQLLGTRRAAALMDELVIRPNRPNRPAPPSAARRPPTTPAARAPAAGCRRAQPQRRLPPCHRRPRRARSQPPRWHPSRSPWPRRPPPPRRRPRPPRQNRRWPARPAPRSRAAPPPPQVAAAVEPVPVAPPTPPVPPPAPPPAPSATPRSLPNAPGVPQPASRPAEAPAPPAAAAHETAPPTDHPDKGYLDAVFERLRRLKDYPELAKYHTSGRVLVAFTVGRDGTVLNAEVRRSSGYPFIDRAGLDLIRRASPLPALPGTMAGDSFPILVPISFRSTEQQRRLATTELISLMRIGPGRRYRRIRDSASRWGVVAKTSVSRKLPVALCALGFALSLGACATAPADPESKAEFAKTNDPAEPTNRAVFDFNQTVDRNLFKPVAQAYQDNLPDGVRRGVHNFLTNLDEPLVSFNDLLQANGERALTSSTRFMINTTLGIGGIFDLAGDWGLPHHDSDFGQTFGVWGIGEGPYITLPIFGPSNARDAVGLALSFAANPLTWMSGGAAMIAGAGRAGHPGRRRACPQHRHAGRSAAQLARLLRHLAQRLSPASQRHDRGRQVGQSERACRVRLSESRRRREIGSAAVFHLPTAQPPGAEAAGGSGAPLPNS
ncbi:MAG: TonB family protein [Pseudomonadota bacterium]